MADGARNERRRRRWLAIHARDALRAAEPDDLNRRARVLDALADILERRREAESISLRRRALELYERKGNVVSAELRTALGERALSPQ